MTEFELSRPFNLDELFASQYKNQIQPSEMFDFKFDFESKHSIQMSTTLLSKVELTEISVEEFCNMIKFSNPILNTFFISDNISLDEKYDIINYIVSLKIISAEALTKYFIWNKKPPQIFLSLAEYVLRNYSHDILNLYNMCITDRRYYSHLLVIKLFLEYGLNPMNLDHLTIWYTISSSVYTGTIADFIYIMRTILENDSEFFTSESNCTFILSRLIKNYNSELYHLCIDYGLNIYSQAFQDFLADKKFYYIQQNISGEFIIELLQLHNNYPNIFHDDVMDEILAIGLKFSDKTAIDYIIDSDISGVEIKRAMSVIEYNSSIMTKLVEKYSTDLSIDDIVTLCMNNNTK